MTALFKKLDDILTRKEKRKFAVLIVVILGMALLEVVSIASILPFMQIVSQPDVLERHSEIAFVYDYFGFGSTRAFFLTVGAAVLVIMTISKGAAIATKWMEHRFVWDSAHSIAMRLLTTYLRQPYTFFLDNEPTKLQKQVIGEVQQLVREVLLPLVQLIAQGTVSIIIFILLTTVHWGIALTLLVSLGGLYAIIYLFVRRRLFKMGRVRFQLFRRRFKTVAEVFGAIKAVKIQGCEPYFGERFRVVDERFSKIQPRFAVISDAPKSLIQLLAFGGIVVVLLYFLAIGQEIVEVIPLLSLYAVAGNRLMPSLQQTFSSLTRLRFSHDVLDSIHHDLTTVDVKRDPATTTGRVTFERQIELRDVSFRYSANDAYVLEDINLTIAKNERVAFVGSTGSGKSTLVDLVMGLLTPNTGAVLVDGVPIDAANHAKWQRATGYVPQEVALIDDSVTRNIAFGRDDQAIDMNRVRRAAATARIDIFVEQELSEGYDTHVGEKGVRLSGGQRQRIGLARALYDDPEVLILDEATSALDGITEDAVMGAISELDRSITTIIIAHRLATVVDCDRIFLLEEGHVVAEGDYDDLIDSNHMFRKMARAAS